MSRIALIGLGLMGGSMGLALRDANPTLEIIGMDEPSVVDQALRRGAITASATSATEAVEDADIVILATPLSVTLGLLDEIGRKLKPGTLVHDICSVKSPVAACAEGALDNDVLFVGGHPMTGSEKSGIRHADGLLFENATYVLCPSDSTVGSEAYAELQRLLSSIGARLLEMDAQVHDRIAARVSHLPQLLSVLLVNLASSSRKQDRNLLDLAAGGFRDMTRIAGSPFPMWHDILAGNREEVLSALADFEGLLSDLRADLASNTLDAVGERFRDAEQTRNFIPSDRKGFLQPLADVYVFTSDRPGALVDMTSALHTADLSIKDIELLRIRENTGGTFRIGFETPSEADAAVRALSEAGFLSYRL
jgi:prephenate dehydrogenase